MALEKPKYKLTYFQLPGKAEAIRATLTVAKEEFEDCRLSFSDWKELKPKARYGSLPILELEDGTTMCQSKNILRYIGRMTGYYPFHDPKRASKVDEIVDVWDDIGAALQTCGKNLSEEERNAAREKCMTTGKGATLLKNLDTFIGETSGGTFAVGNQLSVADMCTWASSNALVCGFFDGVPTDCLNSYSNINKIRYNFAKRADMAKYLNKHFGGDEGKFSVYATINDEGAKAPPPVDESPVTEEQKETEEDNVAGEEVATN